MRRASPLVLALALLAFLAPAVAEAKPRALDRIVAVVGPTPILDSELAARARPYLKKLDEQHVAPAARPAAEAEMRRALVERMIDEHLIENEARRLDVMPTESELDRAERSAADRKHLSVEGLYADASRQGVDAVAYRAELRHQLLEAKVIERVLHPRLKKGLSPSEREEALGRERAAWLAKLRDSTYVDQRL